MAWNIQADLLETCSCAALCPCVFGPAKPDQEWCSGIFAITVAKGESDGVDLSGVKMLVHFQLPGDFMGGIDKAKLYYDTSASDDQRRELDAIFHGERGGLWGGMSEAIGEWLPSAAVGVEITDGDSPTVRVEGIGEANLELVKTESGKQTTLSGAPVLEAFGIDTVNIARSNGTKFSDPDMRSWESLGSGTVPAQQVSWSG
jgi:hypothetical protein